MQYRAAPHAPFTHAAAQMIGETLEALGRFTTAEVVNIARDTESILHPYFEWDDQSAGVMFREHQARQLINHVCLVVKIEGEERTTKAFHHVAIAIKPVDDGNGYAEHTYVTVNVARQNEEMKKQIIAKALSELKAWQRRYADYAYIFGDLFEEIDRAIPQVQSRIATMAQLQ